MSETKIVIPENCCDCIFVSFGVQDFCHLFNKLLGDTTRVTPEYTCTVPLKCDECSAKTKVEVVYGE